MLPSSKTTVPESGMMVSGDSLPVSSAKKCEKSRKLLVGKQVKVEDDDNDGNKCRWISLPQETNCPMLIKDLILKRSFLSSSPEEHELLDGR